MNDKRINIRNVPTPDGRAVGEQLARLTEIELAKLRVQFPNHAEPCGTCAFRRGTYPNGCPATVMDAIKCVVEDHEFMCHEHRKGEPMVPCTGWMIAVGAAHRGMIPSVVRVAAANWEYTREPGLNAHGSDEEKK